MMPPCVVVALLWLQAAQQPAAPPSPPTALIVGRVVDAASGRPVPGATVSISGSAAGFPTGPRLLTDPQGRFVYRNLRKGSYSLTVTQAGYMDGAFGRLRPEGLPRPLQLAEGERATDVTIQLWKFGAISGVVSDEAGEPVVSAPVRTFRRTRVGGKITLRQAGSGTTDDRGLYRVSRLAPGEYLVYVNASNVTVPASLADAYRAGAPNDPARRELSTTMFSLGSFSTVFTGPLVTRIGDHVVPLERGVAVPAGDGLPTMVYPVTYYPGTPVASESTVITLSSGEERTGADIQLRPLPAVKVSGSVMLPDGPAVHFAIRLEPPAAVGANLPMNPIGPATATDASGAFTFLSVPAGSYTLRVTKTPVPPFDSETTSTTVVQGGAVTFGVVSSGGPVNAPLPTDPTWWAEMPLQVGRRDITNLQVALQAGPKLSGRVEFEGAAERPDDQRLWQIPINVSPADGSFLSGVRPGRIAADGTFRTMGIPGGKYYIRVPGQPAGWTLKSAMYQGRDLADTPIDLTGGDITGIVVTFTDRPIELSGTVQGASGPDPEASVVVFPVDPALWTLPSSRRVRIVRVGQVGAFSITGLPQGDYYAIAIPDELAADWNDPRSLEAFAREGTQVSLEQGTKTQPLRTVRPRRLP